MTHSSGEKRTLRMPPRLFIALAVPVLTATLRPAWARDDQLATLQEVIDSKLDLWGAALKEPGGPSYAFFEKLLPPLRYVDADFRFTRSC